MGSINSGVNIIHLIKNNCIKQQIREYDSKTLQFQNSFTFFKILLSMKARRQLDILIYSFYLPLNFQIIN